MFCAVTLGASNSLKPWRSPAAFPSPLLPFLLPLPLSGVRTDATRHAIAIANAFFRFGAFVWVRTLFKVLCPNAIYVSSLGIDPLSGLSPYRALTQIQTKPGPGVGDREIVLCPLIRIPSTPTSVARSWRRFRASHWRRTRGRPAAARRA
jgi:hypothetical protein